MCVPSAPVAKTRLPVCQGTCMYLQTLCLISAGQDVWGQFPVITAKIQMMLSSLLAPSPLHVSSQWISVALLSCCLRDTHHPARRCWSYSSALRYTEVTRKNAKYMAANPTFPWAMSRPPTPFLFSQPRASCSGSPLGHPHKARWWTVIPPSIPVSI